MRRTCNLGLLPSCNEYSLIPLLTPYLVVVLNTTRLVGFRLLRVPSVNVVENARLR